MRRLIILLITLSAFWISTTFAEGPLEPVGMQGQCLQTGVLQKPDKSGELQQWLKQWPSAKRGYLVTLTDCDQHSRQDWDDSEEQLSGIQGNLAVMKFRNSFIPVVNNGRLLFKSYPVQLQQGRLVFRDQKKQVRCLIPKSRFRFEHAPLEQCQNDPELKELSRWLYALPPEPGEEGLSGLVGIDFDQDGIRDDVQRFIEVTVQDEPAEVVEAIKKIAVTKQKELSNAYYEDKILELLPESLAAIYCFIHRTDQDPERYGKKMQAKIYNTIERLKALNKINSYYGGLVLAAPENYETQCNFKPQ